MARKVRSFTRVLALTTLVVGAVQVPAAGVPLVRNGDFETGNDAEWKVSTLGAGTWQVYDDPSAILGDAIEPPQGRYAIATSQPAPGSLVLSQVVRLPKDVRLELRFRLWYSSQAAITVPDPDTLRHDVPDVPNQQFRVDVIKAGARLRTLKPAAILATVFRTRNGGPQTIDETTITKRLTALGGQRVRLRFVEVSNQENLTVVVDRVRIDVG